MSMLPRKIKSTPAAQGYLAQKMQDLHATALGLRTETYTVPETNHWLIIQYHVKPGEYDIFNPVRIPYAKIPRKITLDYDGEYLICR